MSVIKPVRRQLSIELCLQLATAMQRAGCSAHRLEENVAQVGHCLGLEVSAMALPSGIMISFGGENASVLRVPVERHNLALLSALLNFSYQLTCEEKPDPIKAMEDLERIVTAPPTYPPSVRALAFTVAGGIFSVLFGGGWREALVGLAVGLAVGLNAVWGDRFHRLRRMPELVSALAGSLIANLGGHFLGCSAFVPMLGGLLFALPGVTFVVGVAELANRSVMSGTARLASAAVGFMAVVFAAALGERVLGWFLKGELPLDPVALPPWVTYALLPVAGLAVAIYMRARRRDIPWIVLCCFFSFCVARGTMALAGEDWLGTFAGALAAGLCGNLYARISRGPAVHMLVSGIYLLGPASLGLRGLQAMFSGDTQAGIALGFQMGLRGMGLVAGLLFASLLLPPPAPATRNESTSRELWHSDRL